MLNLFELPLSASSWYRCFFRLSLAVFISTLLSGCDEKIDAKMIEDSSVLALVNDEAITVTDVDFMLERMLQGKAMAQADNTLRKKILDSLIASRAMRQHVKGQLSTNDIKQIAQAVKVYEEELFVKAYLQQFVVPEPVTVEMIQQYYDAHTEDFGGKIIRAYEILYTPTINNEPLRNHLLAAIPEITAVTDWQKKAEEWKKNYNLQYRQGRSQAGVLNKNIDQVMLGLEEGKTSDVIYIDGELYLLRVTGIEKATPKPLVEVSEEIRNKLALQVLREAVRKASDDARKKAKIEILSTL